MPARTANDIGARSSLAPATAASPSTSGQFTVAQRGTEHVDDHESGQQGQREQGDNSTAPVRKLTLSEQSCPGRLDRVLTAAATRTADHNVVTGGRFFVNLRAPMSVATVDPISATPADTTRTRPAVTSPWSIHAYRQSVGSRVTLVNSPMTERLEPKVDAA
jgi:hypothetical protein